MPSGPPRLLVELGTFFYALSLRRLARWLLVFGLLYVIYWLFMGAGSALVPFIAGVVLAYLLLPLVNRLESSMPRWSAIIVVYAFSLLVLGIFIGFIVPPLIDQFNQLVSRIPSFETLRIEIEALMALYRNSLDALPENVQVPLENGINQSIASARDNLTTYLQNIGSFLINSIIQVGTTVATTLTFLLGFFLIPFWLFYTMMDQQRGLEAVNSFIPPRLRADFWAITTILDRVLSGYVRGQLILGFSVALAAAIGLTVLGWFGFQVPYILLLAVLAGITELIPVIGPIIGAVPAIILGFLDSPTTGIAVTILYIAIQQLENNLLVPRIVGDSVDIHPAVLMVLLVVYSQIFGLIGAIISAPLTAMVRDVFVYMYGRLEDPPRPAGELPKRLQRPGPAPPMVAAMAPAEPEAAPLHAELEEQARIEAPGPESGADAKAS
jgi:predicted PurR-regulated permease PerM